MEQEEIEEKIKQAFEERRKLIGLVNADNDERIYEEGQRPRPSVTKVCDIRFHELDQLEKEFVKVGLLPSLHSGN